MSALYQPIHAIANINGAHLPYFVQGEGQVVLLLHGALTDHRMWHPHCDILSQSCKAIAYTQRYCGTGPWEEGWPSFGVDTHASDLLGFVQTLGLGPVHLVAWSYAGHIALHAVLQRPDLFQSLFIYEPGTPTYVSDPSELKAFAADANEMYGPIFEAVQDLGDNEEGVRRLLDGSRKRTGYFASQPLEDQRIQMENARTLPLLLTQAPAPNITCEQLGSLVLPTCITWGEGTRPIFSIVARAAARCIPHSRAQMVPKVGHMWPSEDPAGFAGQILDFLKTL